jgi:hypothetical protein
VVKFSFSVIGFEYENGLRVIKRTYEAASRNLDDQKIRCYGMLEAIRRGELSNDYDPANGEISPESEYEFEIMNIVESAQLLRQASLLMAYHFWEKQVLTWTGGKTKKMKGQSLHDSYVAYCQSQSFDVDVTGLKTLHLIANSIKHGQGNSEWVSRLYEHDRSLFIENAQSHKPLDYLCISNDRVMGFFGALEKSGPDAFGNFTPAT